MPEPLHKVFLLSPAYAGGARARMLLNENAQFDLAVRLRGGEATVGEVFSFVSGLYFRGKMAYAQAFAAPPDGAPASAIITPARGLMSPDAPFSLEEFRAMGDVDIDVDDPRYLLPLVRDVQSLATCTQCAVILLGSIASTKYVPPLIDAFGERLLFPADFVGRGDMSRGGLMLRSAREGTELSYVPAAGAVLRGQRPPRLPKLVR